VVLAFDTAGSACSVAVGSGDTLLASERHAMRHGHAEALLPMIERVMAAAELKAADIDAVAVSLGPGGFTGIRAGLAAAHGLALAARARVIGVTSFAAVAARIPKGVSPLLAALDSRREDFYLQLFAGDGSPRGEPEAVLPGALGNYIVAALGDAALRIAGDAAEAAAAALTGRAGIEILPGTAPDACGVLDAACERLSADLGEAPARPLYLRPPDVTMPRPRRAAGGA
jgi:tRNA threonylcarbamoyladenosine biosynthesis protein TsaB